MNQVWTWRHAIWESDLAATTKLVLQALASHLNDMGGPMFPSQERLAKLCSLSERAVITHLDVAEEKGWIIARKRELNGKRWAANEYVACFPDGVNLIHPKSSDGVKDVQVQGERGSGDRVKDVHSNIPSESSKEPLPLTSSGGMWEEDSLFMELVTAYTALNPDRVDLRKAWEAWTTGKLGKDAQAILKALPVFARGEQWRREDGRFIPSLSKWLSERGWKNVAAGMPTPEQQRERERIGKAGMAAYARIETDKVAGRDPAAEDEEAVRRWREMQAGLNAKVSSGG